MPKKRVLDWPYLITQKSILSYYYFLWNREDKHKLIGGYEWYIWENWNRQQITITKFEPMSLLLSVRHYDHWAQSSIRFSSCSKEFFDKAPPPPFLWSESSFNIWRAWKAFLRSDLLNVNVWFVPNLWLLSTKWSPLLKYRVAFERKRLVLMKQSFIEKHKTRGNPMSFTKRFKGGYGAKSFSMSFWDFAFILDCLGLSRILSKSWVWA